MRDPELVARAQRAAARLESAWERWKALQGLGETPAQPVVGYVGYALKEPWGQPRAVIGFSADEAERLAEFLERDSGDCGAVGLTALDGRTAALGAVGCKPAEPSRETVPRQGQEQPTAPVLTVPSAITSDILAVTSQLSGSQLGHSFLPGSDARLSITSAGQSDGPCNSRLGSGRPGPGTSPDSYPRGSDPRCPPCGQQTAARGFLPQLFRLREFARRPLSGRALPAARSRGLPHGPWLNGGVTGATCVVQYMHLVAAMGIVLRHSGQSRVVTAACLVKRAVIFAIGATIR
jgi:hypothetical protein